MKTASSFQIVPTRRFFLRMFAPGVSAFFFGFLILGLVASHVQIGADRDPAGVTAPAHPKVNLPPFEMAKYTVEGWTHEVGHVPYTCQGDHALNEVQKNWCNVYYSDLLSQGLLVSIPFFFAILFLFLSRDQLVLLYGRIQKRIAAKQAIGMGVVTEPALMPQDLYGWIFCFQSVSVQLQDGKQVRVYLPLDVAIPLPGEKTAILDGGLHWGRQRFYGVLYAPHLSVLSGR